MTICKPSGKRCYNSKARARKALAGASNRIRVYRCGHCNRYHVTAQAEPVNRDSWRRGRRG